MTEWWTAYHGTLLGSIGGSTLGVVGGIYGALIGMLSHRGIGRRAFLSVHVALVVLGALSLLAGAAAALLHQPYHVYYPLLLLGGIAVVVMGILLPIVIRQYRQADSRKMDAELLRRSGSGQA